MKRVITAIDNSEINESLKNDFEIVSKDISYKEGILEQIEINKKVDLIILDERIDGEIELNILIRKIKEKIKKIEIIIITENKNKIINDLKRYKRIKIYETNKIKLKKLINLISLEEEIQENKMKEEDIKIDEENIISISGTDGVGKTITSIIFSICLKSKNLLIEINSENNQDITSILNKKNKKINFISLNKMSQLKKIINKNKFKNIIIDLGNKNNDEEKEFILNKCKLNIILLEPNLLGIKKCKKIIDNYLKNINKNKLLILINNKNKNSIDTNVIKNIFKDIKIIGEINYNIKYDQFLNKEFKNLEMILSKKEKQNYKKILNQIFTK